MRNIGKLYFTHSDHYGGEADTLFALKSLQKDYPFLIIAWTLMINVVVCGLLLRMFEMYI